VLNEKLVRFYEDINILDLLSAEKKSTEKKPTLSSTTPTLAEVAP
jgi:hypothetical protein